MRYRHPRSTAVAGPAAMLLVCFVLTAATLCAATPPALAAGGEALPSGPFVARVYYNQISDIDRLAAYDVWEVNNRVEKYVLVSMDRAIYEDLALVGWRMEIDDFATSMLKPTESFSAGYRTVDELYADLISINAAHTGITDLVDYGDSYCKTIGGCVTLGGDLEPGYDLMAIRVTNEAIPGPKPVFFLMAGIHAREITTPELAMRMLDLLVNGYGVDPDVTWVVDHHETWIVPTVNPDGHWLVELGTKSPYNGSPFFQRKNGNASNGCTVWPPNSFSQYGIDMNRNHTFEWNTGGSSNAPCDQTYRGPSAGSEVETSSLETLIKSLIPDQRGPNPTDLAPYNATGIMITLHSYGNLVLWPWGNRSTAAPNAAGLKGIGDKFATYNGYQACQSGPCLYTVSGSSDDFVYGELGSPAYTFEIGTQFMPPYSEIDAVQWPKNGPALEYAAKIARTPYKLAFGPDALNVTITDNHNGTHTLTATIDDTKNGNNAITKAAFLLDTPYWLGGSITPMQPVDGSYNSPVEAVTATIDTSSLASGRHMIFVHGKDSTNRFGPAGAVFLDIP